jgi:hypothetical protein
MIESGFEYWIASRSVGNGLHAKNLMRVVLKLHAWHANTLSFVTRLITMVYQCARRVAKGVRIYTRPIEACVACVSL